MSTRYERMLEAIANGQPITDEPTCRVEKFLKALANKEDPSTLPDPICREEKYWLSIIKGEKITDTPTCKKEEYLKAIANNESLPSDSGSYAREMFILKKLVGNTGGGSSEPDTPVTPDEPIVNLNYVENNIFYIREAYSATQTADAITLR